MSKIRKYLPRLDRRGFLKSSSTLAAVGFLPQAFKNVYEKVKTSLFYHKEVQSTDIVVNGKTYDLEVDSRSTVLDLLREQIGLTGTKKGCDHGQCGACTVHINGRRTLSCLTLAVMAQGKEITTIEGIANGEELHPMQEAFLEQDGFQCGYCTPGQIMSAIGCVNEGRTGSTEEIKEFMSGNLCRCGAYNGITNAIKQVAQ